MHQLTELANNFKTDKGTQQGAAHGYSLIYDMFLAPMRSLPRIDILEMGLAIGGPELGGDINRSIAGAPSIDTWLSYFENAHVVGFDISDFSKISHERFHFVRGDSGRVEDLERLRSLGRRFDFILDDASHASYHQQLALSSLFDLLNPGGLYLIEDLGWRPEGIERQLPTVPHTSQVLEQFLANGRFPCTEAVSDTAAAMLEQQVGGVLLFDESTLNANGDSFNRRFSLPQVKRDGWRSKRGATRMLDPHFWLYNLRRFSQSLKGTEFANQQSIKMAVLQRTT